jgi:mannose-6-phosphate isomerase-like protein (cupin superfamily)/hemerythrin superfamily protein
MKRHPALEPFSRDHNVSLVLARELSRQDQGSGEKLLAVWRDEMHDHFSTEERLLSPLATKESAERLTSEHRLIESLVERIAAEPENVDLLSKVGRVLDAHVRWEEQEFFPEIERSASARQLSALAKSTEQIEVRRRDSVWAPRRGELMAKRKFTCDVAALASSDEKGPMWAIEIEDLDCTLLRWPGGHAIVPHVNNEVDVVMSVFAGTGILEVDGVKTRLKAGTIVVIPKNTERSIRVDDGPLIYLNVHKRRRRLMPTGSRQRGKS